MIRANISKELLETYSGRLSMRYNHVSSLWVLLFIAVMVPYSVADTAKVLRVSMPLMDDDPENGIVHPIVQFVEYWGEITDTELVIERFPFKRSIRNAATGQADFHFPLILDRDDVSNDNDFNHGFSYSTMPLIQITFILYTRTDNPLDLNKLSEYRIATFGGHANLFPFPVEEDYSIEGSLMKLNTGRIDGYIFADSGGDPTLLELGLTGIKRQLYKVYDVHAVLPISAAGKETDKFITEVATRLASEELPAMWKLQEYVDWQVSDDVIPRIVQE